MKLTDKIILSRKTKGLTQAELADMSGIALRTIQRIEKGETIPRGFTLKAISKALSINIEEFTANTQWATDKNEENQVKDFLQYLNLSSFAYLFLPFGNIILPWILWRKRNDNEEIYHLGKKILSYHIIWNIVTYLALFIMVAVMILGKYYFGFKTGIGILLTFLVMYMINIPIILYAAVRLKRGSTNPYPTNGRLDF